jgi:hypothetical protein
LNYYQAKFRAEKPEEKYMLFAKVALPKTVK